MPRVLYTTHAVKAESGVATSANTAATGIMWPGSMAQIGIDAPSTRTTTIVTAAAAAAINPVTPTNTVASSSVRHPIVVTPSSSGRRGTAAAFAIVKQESLRTPMAGKMRSTPTAAAFSSGGSSSFSSDHEYGQYSVTPQQHIIGSGAGQQKRTIYLTPSTSGHRSFGSTTSSGGANGGGGMLVVPQVKSEARRKLNLDSAAVDQDGFKTPIKGGSKRRSQDLSSPSPKKSEFTIVTQFALLFTNITLFQWWPGRPWKRPATRPLWVC